MNEPQEIKPWYREPWPWAIIGSLSVVVAACFVTLGLAIWSYDGLVEDDYYKKGLAINQTLARAARSEELLLTASLSLLPDGTVRMVLNTPDATFIAPDEVQLKLVHPRFPAQDRHAMLQRVGDNAFNGAVTPLSDGRWRVILESDEWRLDREIIAPVKEVVIKARD